MRARCALCDIVDTLDDQSDIAKRLRNRPIHTYLCKSCHDRVSQRTIERWETGKFRASYKKKRMADDW